MNESYSRLSDAIHSKKYNGQLDDIRRLFRYLELPPQEGSGLMALLAGNISGAAMALFLAWVIWG